MPDVSIVICTYNRCELILAALRRLLAQDTGGLSIEIIAVDNNSTDGTARALKTFVDAAPNVRHVLEPRQGISHARNLGIKLARAPIIAFTDDDVLVPADWALRIAAAFDGNKGIDCVGGKVLPAWPMKPPAWLTRDHWSPLAILDYGDAPCVLDERDPRCLIGANIAVRRHVFDQLGGFSPEVQRVRNGIGSIEDHEFLIRFWNMGGRALYLPDLVVTAPVDACRMDKPYHRRWHEGHGHFHAVMRSSHLERSQTGRLFDVPAHLYRQFARDTAGWIARLATGRFDDAFRPETRMRFFKGFVRKRVRDWLAQASPRSIRAPIVKVAHRVDDRLARARGLPRQVMFEAANPMLFDVFRPVYDRLASDPRIAVTLVPHGTEFSADAIFAAASGSHRIVTPARAAWMKPDVYVNTDLWSMTWLHRRTRRVHLFHGVAGKYGLDAPAELAGVTRAFDAVLFPNADRLERYVTAGLVDRARAILTGFPKADCLVNGSFSRDDVLARLRLDGSRPTVIYAPTWSAHSSLNAVGERVITTLADAGLNVIVKLHACSYTPRGSGGVDWRTRLGGPGERPTVRLVEEADASPYLVASDLLITDHSTVGFEFMLLDRPVVVLHQPELLEGARINPDKVTLLRSAARLVSHTASLAAVVMEELSSPNRLSAERRRAASTLFYRPGEATDRATAAIYELVGLSRADAVNAA